MTILTTTSSQLIINTSKYYNKFRHIQYLLVQITLPYLFIVACIGFITNTSTIVLLSKSFVTKNTRHKWTLIALGLSDLIHNSALLIRVIHDLTNGRIEYLCIIISFLSHLAELLSACFTVLFTIQRYIAVRYPLEHVVQKRSSPFIIIILIFLSSLLFCIVLLYKNTYIDCHEELKLSWFIVDALSSFIIPFSLILIFNISIVNLIRNHARSSISKQSILLRPQKSVTNKRNFKMKKLNHQEETHITMYSYGNLRALEGRISETDMENKLSSTSSSITKQTKKPKLSSHISNENQTSEISIPISQMEKISSDAHSSTSSRPSIKSQNENNNNNKTSKRRRISHQSNEIDFISNKNTHTNQSMRVTRMLILVSTCFLILNAPAHLCIITMKIYTSIEYQIYNDHIELENFQQIKNLTNNQLKNFVFIQTNNNIINKNEQIISHDMDIVDDQIIIHLFYIAVLITQLISYASYSINFFLYSFSGITFRTSLRQLWKKLCKH